MPLPAFLTENPNTTIPIIADIDMDMMTGRDNPRFPKDHNHGKTSGIPGKKNPASNLPLYRVSAHSLSGFLNEEPDIYSDADLKIRNPATFVTIKKSDDDIRQGRVKTITSVDDLLRENI